MKKFYFTMLMIISCFVMMACGNQDGENKNIKKIGEILGDSSTVEITESGDEITIVKTSSSNKSDIQEAVQKCIDSGFSTINMEIHGKYGTGFCEITSDSSKYWVLYNNLEYIVDEADFYRTSECMHPYLISDEAGKMLYITYHLTDKEYYEQYTVTPDGVFDYTCDSEETFFDQVFPKSYEIAEALFIADSHLIEINFNVKNSYYGAHYRREQSGDIVEQVQDTQEFDESNLEPTGVDPSDIHTYVDCGDVVQYSDITDDGDFGDVDLEEVVSERYVTIYSDGTFYYMFDYMNNKITIAYIE